MDENYLDSLLNEMSLDEEMSHNEEVKLDKELSEDKQLEGKEEVDLAVEQDAVEEPDKKDLKLDMDSLDELDVLNELADLDMENLDFDDLDFDDLDITKVSLDSNRKKRSRKITGKAEALKDTEQFEIASFYQEEPQAEEGLQAQEDENTEENVQIQLEKESVNHNNVGESAESEAEVEVEVTEQNENAEKTQQDLDDLFSMLGIEDETTAASEEAAVQETEANDAEKNEETDGSGVDSAPIEGVELSKSPQKTKKSLSQVIFGDPDEDEEEGKTLEELEKEKALKAEKKRKKQEAQKIKKEQDKAKQKAKEAKNSKAKALKAQKKEKKRMELAAAAATEKKLNKGMLAVVFSFFAIFTVSLLFGTQVFNYNLAIHKATDYFERQKYRLAYDEILGIEVKNKDKELEEKIYTVMYVERLYESYENNVALDRPEKALDSLLRGVQKYDEHYTEAVALGIVSDIDSSLAKIEKALLEDYGITLEKAHEILRMDTYAYGATIKEYGEQAEQTQKQPDLGTPSDSKIKEIDQEEKQ